MKLIKDICKKCWKEHGYNWCHTTDNWFDLHNTLVCVVEGIPKYSVVFDDYSELDDCVYKIEQMMSNLED